MVGSTLELVCYAATGNPISILWKGNQVELDEVEFKKEAKISMYQLVMDRLISEKVNFIQICHYYFLNEVCLSERSFF